MRCGGVVAWSLLVSAAVVAACVSSSDPQTPAPGGPRLATPTLEVPAAPSPAVEAAAVAAPAVAAPGLMPGQTKLSALAPVDACTGTAIVFALDRSGSMTGMPLDMAKAAVAGAIDALANDDCAGVLVFDSAPSRVVPLSLPSDRAGMKASIDAVRAGGGTELGSALAAAHDDISAARRAKRRAVILLTDGQSPAQGLREIVDSMARQGVTITTIGLGSGIDAQLLGDLASRGNGRFLHFGDPSTLPGAVASELKFIRSLK